MGATAQFTARTNVQHAHRLPILFAKQHHGASFLSGFNVHDPRLRWGIGQHLRVHAVLNLANLSIGDGRVVGEVKTSALRVDQAAFLLHMVAQHFAQGFVHQVRGAVVAHSGRTGCFIHLGHNGVTHLEGALSERAVVAKHIRFDLLGVFHCKQHAMGCQSAFIAHLAPAFAVKRRGAQHHHALLTCLKRRHRRASCVERNDGGALCGQAVVAHKVIALAGVIQCFVHLELARRTALRFLFFHSRFEAGLVHRQAALTAHVSRQIERKTKRVV